MNYGNQTDARERIAHYAKSHGIEFNIEERDANKWFVYGYNVSTLIPSRQSTTYVGVFPPNEYRHVWEWSNMNGAAPSKKECEFFDYICSVFQRYGSFSGTLEGILPSTARYVGVGNGYMTRESYGTYDGGWC